MSVLACVVILLLIGVVTVCYSLCVMSVVCVLSVLVFEFCLLCFVPVYCCNSLTFNVIVCCLVFGVLMCWYLVLVCCW